MHRCEYSAHSLLRVAHGWARPAPRWQRVHRSRLPGRLEQREVQQPWLPALRLGRHSPEAPQRAVQTARQPQQATGERHRPQSLARHVTVRPGPQRRHARLPQL